MTAYLLRRLWQMIPTLAGVVLLVFFLFKYFGGDPAEILAGQNASAEVVQSIRTQLGLDQPVWVQLWIFVKQVVTFDWGLSWTTKEPVSAMFVNRLPATLTVMVPIFILEVVLAIPLALGVAYLRGSLTDRTVMIVTTIALSISFLVYVIVGQYVFAFRLGWFPVQGWSDSTWTNLVRFAPLPVLLAVFVSLSPTTRVYRSFFLDEMDHDYVRTARAKGLHPVRVTLRHVLRNALLPLTTVAGAHIGGLLGGAAVAETVFSWPGIGRLTLEAVQAREYRVLLGVLLLSSFLVILANVLVDLLHARLDPRIKGN